jgi:hypothetical protein
MVRSQAKWLMPGILATWEVEIKRITVKASPRGRRYVRQTPSPK